MQKIAKVTFYGGAGSVTGANFLLEADGKKILIDCGMFQGIKTADNSNWAPFIYDPKEIDMLFVTHAHVDHIGRIPKLVHEGFDAPIYSTLPTKDLTPIMLQDTAFILSHKRDFDLKKVYSNQNLRKASSLWQGLEYHQEIKITENLSVKLLNAGHILGSAMVYFTYNGKKILFTGDLGNSPSPLLPDTEQVVDADYVIMESVYGDRNHESRNGRRKQLEQVIEDNYKRGGALIIPTFSLERSQELLFELNELVEHKRIPHMSIFFDSPLAIKLTEIFKKYKSYFNDRAKKAMIHDKYIFNFPGLHSTLHTEESKEIVRVANPKVVIAGSGMSIGGRVVHHEKHYLPDKKNTLLLLGYQAVGTPGRLIQEGVKMVRIAGEYIKVHANIRTIYGYSGHKDSDHLLEFVEGMREEVKKVYAVMGEPKSALFLVQKLRDNLGINAYVPEQDEVAELLC